MIRDTVLFVVAVIPLIVAVLLSIYEVIRRDDLPVVRKLAWIAVLVVVPPIGLLFYVVARPPRHRAAVAEAAEGARRAEQLVDLVEQRSLGRIDDDAYGAALRELHAEPSRRGAGAQNS